MEIILPKTVGTRNLPALFSICGQIIRAEDKNIILNAKDVEFFEPHGIAILGALLDGIPGAVVSMPWLSTNLAGYLDRMNFFKYIEIGSVEIPDQARHDRSENLVELTRIDDSTRVESVANQLADAITGNITNAQPDAPLNPDTGRNQYDKYRHPIWYSLSELLENAVTHAKMHGFLRSKVWVAAQFYQTTGEIKVSIVDNGCGFLRSLGNHPDLTNHTHIDAIRTALKPMISCNRDSPYALGHGNQGVGLTTTMRIAHAAKGKLMISSGNSYLETREMKGGELPDGGAWQGVAIAITFKRHMLPTINVGRLLPSLPTGGSDVTINFVD